MGGLTLLLQARYGPRFGLALIAVMVALAAPAAFARFGDQLDCEQWDTAMGQPGMSYFVEALGTYDGALIAGGSFSEAGGQTVNRIARWNEAKQEWEALGGGMNATVRDVIEYNGDLIATGNFLSAGQVVLNRVGRWDGEVWHPLGNGLDSAWGEVLEIYDGNLIVGGYFTGADGTGSKSIAAWNGIMWQPVKAGIEGTVSALAVHDDLLFIGGTYTETADGVAADNIIAYHAQTDLWIPIPGTNGSVLAIEVFGGELYIAGSFTTAGSSSANRIARWNAKEQDWDSVGADSGTIGGNVFDLLSYGDHLYVAGEFLAAGDFFEVDLVRWDGSNWSALPGGSVSGKFNPDCACVFGFVHALTVFGESIVAGGGFVSAGSSGSPANNIAMYDPSCPFVTEWLGGEGEFFDPINWTNGVPQPSDIASFGEEPSGFEYDVTFLDSAVIGGLVIPHQRPRFLLGNQLLQINSDVYVGGGEAFATFKLNGWLSAPGSDVHLLPASSMSLETPNSLLTANRLLIYPVPFSPTQPSFFGQGLITVDDEVVNGGLLNPAGFGQPFSAGLLEIYGDYRQQPTGRIGFLLHDQAHSQLAVYGTATLAGNLYTVISPQAMLSPGTTFPVIIADSIEGAFDSVLLDSPGKNLGVTVEVTGGGGLAGTDWQGVNIVILPPGSSPNFDDPDTLPIVGTPTSLSAPLFNPEANAYDLALTVVLDGVAGGGTNGLVVVMRNDGAGESFTTELVEVGNDPVAMVAANLDESGGDEGDDLAVANHADDSVSILFNDGEGGLDRVDVPLLDGAAPAGITAGDFNGDGIVDLAIACENLNAVLLYANDGKRGFTLLQFISVGAAPGPIEAFTSRTDGPVIAVANTGDGTVSVLVKGETGFIAGEPILLGTSQIPVAMTIEDIDNTKDNDIIVVTANGTMAVLSPLGVGPGTYGAAFTLPLTGSPKAVDAWDMDGDDDADIAVVLAQGADNEAVHLFRNDSTSTQIIFTSITAIGQGQHPQLVRGADVTGDQDDDMVTVNFVEVGGEGGLAGAPISAFVAIHPNLGGAPQQPECAADLDGEGNVGVPDLLALLGCWGGVSPECEDADLMKDGSVGVPDLLELLGAWGPCE